MPGHFYTRTRFVLLFLLIAALLLLRKPDLLTNPQLFAEDASIFFRDQWVAPGTAVFLPYNGQFHLVPRLIALLESLFPLAAAPLVCTFASILIHSLCLSVFFLPFNRWLIPNDLLRAAACLVLATAFDGLEMVGFSGPLMWYLFLAGVMMLFRPEDAAPASRWAKVSSVAAMAVIGWSAAPTLTLAPAAVWLAVRRRGVQRAVALTLLGALVVQCFGLVYSERSDRPAQPLEGFIMLGWQVFAATVISWAYAGWATPLGGKNVGLALSTLNSAGPSLFVVIAVAALVTWLFTVSIWRDRLRLAVGFYIALGTLASALYTRDLLGLALALNSPAAKVPARYLVVPGALVVYIVCLILQRLPLRDARLQAACLVLVFAFGIRGNFRLPPYPDYPWTQVMPKVVEWRAARDAGTPKRIDVPIAPPRWFIVLP
jgi:hypothetical protein